MFHWTVLEVEINCLHSHVGWWIYILYRISIYADKVMAQCCNRAAASGGITFLGPNSETKGLVTSTNLQL